LILENNGLVIVKDYLLMIV